jgi:hypothetical protein
VARARGAGEKKAHAAPLEHGVFQRRFRQLAASPPEPTLASVSRIAESCQPPSWKTFWKVMSKPTSFD